MTRQLEWGQTPWDNMERQELLQEVWRMFAALRSCESILDNIKFFDERGSPSPFWSQEGRGGAALEMAHQAMHATQEYDDENLSRTFFRYARDLLFERNGYRMIGSAWVVCPVCGAMYGELVSGETSEGMRCDMKPGGDRGCSGVLRPLEWGDLTADMVTGAV